MIVCNQARVKKPWNCTTFSQVVVLTCPLCGASLGCGPSSFLLTLVSTDIWIWQSMHCLIASMMTLGDAGDVRI